MKTLLPAALVFLLIASSLPAADRSVDVTVDNPILAPRRYTPITGTVRGLRQDESVTVEWRDVLGRLIASERLTRGKDPIVPFAFEMVVAPSTYNRIVALAEGLDKYPPTVSEATFLTPLPPEPWNDYRILLWPALQDRPANYLPALRDAGFSYILAHRADSLDLLLRNNLHFIVSSLLATPSLSQSAARRQELLRLFLENRTPPAWNPADNPLAPRSIITLKEEIAETVARTRYARPAAYAIAQALSLTADGAALDLSFDPLTLEAFRTALGQAYPDVSDLNDQWDTRYMRWSDVMPETSLDVADRYADVPRKRPLYNFAPWLEFRRFMDDAFTGAVENLAAHVRYLDPDTPVGLMGNAPPSAFSGVDCLRLADSLDFFETDPQRVLARLLRARPYQSARTLVQLDIDDDDFDLNLWKSVLGADHGAVLLDDEKFFAEGAQPSAAAKRRLPALRAASAGWLRILSLPAESRNPVALYYSRPSLLAATILDIASKPDDAPDYLASWRPEQATYLVNFLAWCRLLDDLGLPYDVVTADDVRRRDFLDRPYRLLILPKLLAAGPEDVLAVSRFVADRRPVLVDNLAGVMTANGRERDTSPFDELFGIRRNQEPVFSSDFRAAPHSLVSGRLNQRRLSDELAVLRDAVDPAHLFVVEQGLTSIRRPHFYEVGDAHAVLVSTTAANSPAIYLNLSILPYAASDLNTDQARALRTLVKGLLDLLGIRPEVTVRQAGLPSTDLAVVQRQIDELLFVGLVHRRLIDTEDEPREYEVRLPRTANVYDLVQRKYYGPVERFIVKLKPGDPVLLGILPYSVRYMELDISYDPRDSLLNWTASVLPAEDRVRVGHHLFQETLALVDGDLIQPPRTLIAYKGYAERDIPISRDIAPGKYRLTVTDLLTSASAQREFDVLPPPANQ